MTVITATALTIGYVVLGLILLLAILTVISAIHDWIRSRKLIYDLYWYDDVRRWNRKLKRRNNPH